MRLIRPAPLGSSSWLLRLRSIASIGQLLAILVARTLTPIAFPTVPLLLLVAVTASTNFIYGWWLARVSAATDEDQPRLQSTLEQSQKIAFVLMALDLLTLTLMLYFSGGADNPFAFFYFVNIAVAGVMLRPRSAWMLTALSIGGYWWILLNSWPVSGLSVQPAEPLPWTLLGFAVRDWGSWLAFIACSSVITYFVTRTSRQLREREAELRRSEAERADAARLEGLTTLAAGAAHELATPLSTIDIACRELTHHLDGIEKPSSIDDDLKLIDGQLMMCRQILSRMRTAAGDAVADRWNRTTLGDLIDTTLEGIRDPHRVEILEPESKWPEPVDAPATDKSADELSAWESQPMWLPEEAVAQAIRNLIHNGLDASDSGQSVTVRPEHRGDQVVLRVVDRGHGMSEEVIDRAGDPFFTTKDPGRGIGLGLFLTRNVITRLGGRVEFQSSIDQGTTATVVLPLQTPPNGQ